MGNVNEPLEFVHGNSRITVTVEHAHTRLIVHAGTRRVAVTGHLHEDNALEAALDGEQVTAQVAEHGTDLLIKTVNKELALRLHDPLSERLDLLVDDGHLRAPLPGTIAAVYARPGDRVERGQAVLVVEAMKMEHVIRAPMGGVVELLHYEVGDRVDEHDELVVLRSSSA